MKTSRYFCVAALMAFAVAGNLASAGPGHDHGDGTAVTSGNGPKRLPDGSVFLPKPAQRQLGVRTVPVVEAELPRSFELAGRVVMDPNAGGYVQPLLAGRLEAGPRGFPVAGQRVRKGEVLAYVVPSMAAVERSSQTAQLAELKAARSVAEKRLIRLKELADTVPRKEIEMAEAELASLGERVVAIGGGLATREVLVSPVSGIVASAKAVAGQVVDARELVFEVMDPGRLRIEALAYDLEDAVDIASATLAIGNERVPLSYIGTARSLREQALPVSFKAEGAALEKLAIGQPVRVFANTAKRVRGSSVPASALVKNPSNQTVVWVKTAPEHFESRTITVEPLDGVSVAVTAGLKTGDRVVTGAATLVNQIR